MWLRCWRRRRWRRGGGGALDTGGGVSHRGQRLDPPEGEHGVGLIQEEEEEDAAAALTD